MGRGEVLSYRLLALVPVPAPPRPGTATGDTGYVRTARRQASIYFREHSSAVYRYLAGVYGREEDAEEVTQEAFLRLHPALVCERRHREPARLDADRRAPPDARSPPPRGVRLDAHRRRGIVFESVRDPAPRPKRRWPSAASSRRSTHAIRDLTALDANACSRAPRASR